MAECARAEPAVVAVAIAADDHHGAFPLPLGGDAPVDDAEVRVLAGVHRLLEAQDGGRHRVRQLRHRSHLRQQRRGAEGGQHKSAKSVCVSPVGVGGAGGSLCYAAGVQCGPAAQVVAERSIAT